MTSSINKKEAQAWDDFLQNLQGKLPGFVHSWVMSLEPALPLFEESENGIFLIKSNQSFGIQVLQQKYLKIQQSARKVTKNILNLAFKLITMSTYHERG